MTSKNQAKVKAGILGGKAGKGASKRRSLEHYRNAARLRWAKTRLTAAG